MNSLVRSVFGFSGSTAFTSTCRTAIRVAAFMLAAPVLSCYLSPAQTIANPASKQGVGSFADSYVDPATGHTVVRLSREPGRGSYNIYFHQNVFTGAGDKMVWAHINVGPGQSLWSTDISKGKPFGSGKSTHLADTIRLLGFPVVGKRSRDVYYINDHSILATNLDTLKTRTIATTPRDWDMSSAGTQGLSINANETLLAGAITTGADTIGGGAKPNMQSSAAVAAARQNIIQTIFQAHLPTFLYTVNIRSGKINVILRGNEWYDHVQFSPTDPSLILFDHEGPWDKVERLWLIRTDGSGLRNFHPSKVPGSALGHEFWEPGGQAIWFDLSENKGHFLTRQNIVSGSETRYTISAQESSRHYNISHNGRIFAGDGDIGKYRPTIQLLLPQPNGTLQSVPLASVAQNDYSKHEPNVVFTPDDQWVIYSSTQSGQPEIYAVSVNK